MEYRFKFRLNNADYKTLKEIIRIALIGSLLIILVFGCHKNDISKRLSDSGYYAGTFDCAIDIIQDSVYLNISNGYYYCSTNLPYNYGAGRIEISDTKLNFIDTLFFPIPAIYITGFALSGEYKYQYDGANLVLEKLANSGNLIYSLKKIK